MWNQSQIPISRFKVHIWPWVNATRNSHLSELTEPRPIKQDLIRLLSRWAVKEATYKAFSDFRLPFPHIMLKKDRASSKPQLHFTGPVAKWAEDLNVQVICPTPHLLFPCFSWILLQLRIQLFQSHMMATMQWLKSYWSQDLKIVVNVHRFHLKSSPWTSLVPARKVSNAIRRVHIELESR